MPAVTHATGTVAKSTAKSGCSKSCLQLIFLFIITVVIFNTMCSGIEQQMKTGREESTRSEDAFSREPTKDEQEAAAREVRRQQELASQPQLLVVSWHWQIEHGYAIVEGEVKNLTEEPLKGVQAVATFRTKGDELITSEDSFIQYDPLLPNQTSPFKVMARENPAMETANLSFQQFGGATLRSKVKK